MKKIGIIGSGFSGLSCACYLAKLGYEVALFEKNDQVGGRARMFESKGFKFDMGPSWYWMPDVFEKFFADFDKKVSDYYHLIQLDPGFQVIFDKNTTIQIDKDIADTANTFESIEPGAAKHLISFIEEAKRKYKIAMTELVYKPSHSIFEFIRWDIIKEVIRTNLFFPLSKEVRKRFKNNKLRQIMEFPVIFLGAMADKIPALYSIMNYAAIEQGTFYPDGGMVKIIEGMEILARSLGVQIHTNSNIKSIVVKDNKAYGIAVDDNLVLFDAIVSSADYHHTEMRLLEPQYRNYDENYWNTRTFAPSSVIFYIGISKILPKMEHHNLFFDTNYQAHADAIYVAPKWVQEPLFYVCCPSKTDKSVAPPDHENIFILIPNAIQLDASDSILEDYYTRVIHRIESHCGESIKEHVIYKKVFSKDNFIQEYNSYGGNAYGLANTLLQTAFLKPKIRNKKVSNLFYTGQLTVPGPGVPPSLISGKIVAHELAKQLNKKDY